MRQKILFEILTITILFVIVNDFGYSQEDISSILPKANESGAWQPVDSPEKAVDEELYLLIDGGAEIYHEYGFTQAIVQEFKNENQKSINVEIFEMHDPASAYGIYSFKTSSKGKRLNIGDDALLEDYYLNCWKGKFLITTTGFDSTREIVDGLIEIASAIAAKISSHGQKPDLINLLSETGLIDHGVIYLKGPLALFNNYEFGAGDILGVREGVIGNYGQHRIFIFKYADKTECEKRFEIAKNNLKSQARLTINEKSSCPLCAEFGKNEERIFLKSYQKYIIAVVGSLTTNAGQIIAQVQNRINSAR